MDKPHFEILVEQHGPELYRYLWRMLYNPQDAEDCLQESYLRAFRAYPRLDGDANFRAWLYRIATNTALTYVKKRSKRAAHTGDLHENLPHHGLSPAEHVLQNEFLAAVLQAVQALPHKQQAALVMRKYQQMDYDEIAQALACSYDSARANVSQAVRKLKHWAENRELMEQEQSK